MDKISFETVFLSEDLTQSHKMENQERTGNDSKANDPSMTQSFRRSIGNTIVLCPLDKSHRMPLSEFQCHLERCLVGDLMEKTCPRNPHHILDEASYDNHAQHCQDVPVEIQPKDPLSEDSNT